jgi:hypothetical protein
MKISDSQNWYLCTKVLNCDFWICFKMPIQEGTRAIVQSQSEKLPSCEIISLPQSPKRSRNRAQQPLTHDSGKISENSGTEVDINTNGNMAI